MSFPKDFLFGAATGAYQIEGGWNADGKGVSIWDHMVHTNPDSVSNRDNGNIACDSYHLFKEDVACLKQAGLQVYRFSISWPRILPTGDITSINQAGVNYYNDLIDELLKNGIQPLVTIYHWDLPQRLQDMGGWLNPIIGEEFYVDYAYLCIKLFGDRVKWWVTINEPRLIVSGYAGMEKRNVAPNLKLDSPANYIVTYNLLKAHARVYHLYDQKFRAVQKGKIGITIDGTWLTPETPSNPEDVEATERAWAFQYEIFANPIFGEKGDFPELVKKIVAQNSEEEGRPRSRLPEFTEEEIKYIKGTFDFLGLNNYSTWLCVPDKGPEYASLAAKDAASKTTSSPEWDKFHGDWNVVPWGLREILRFIKENYNNPPVFITENGYCHDSRVLDDVKRINYYRGYLQEVAKARDEYHCNVIGYVAWALLDNFEWTEGYKYRFGLFDVDFNDPKRKRTPKSSVKFFKQLVETGTIPDE